MSKKEPIQSADFWKNRNYLNGSTALPYQWKMYQQVGTIDNFRIAAGQIEGRRRGYFHTDSDLHKWADAACRCLSAHTFPQIEGLLSEYVELMAASQSSDGYLYTYNQIDCGQARWQNLLVEHELYCHGHFIEAGVEHAALCEQRAESSRLLPLAERSAELVCREFCPTTPKRTPGHQEIEIALLRLYELTGRGEYHRTAMEFLNRRGRMLIPAIALARDDRGRKQKANAIQSRHVASGSEEEMNPGYDLDETGYSRELPFVRQRLKASQLTGRYLQHHRPVRGQTEPVGHAVRWAYMMTAAAMAGRGLGAEPGDGQLLQVAAESLRRMLDGKTYVTGGIGSLPMIEGFGRRWELNDEFAYCETCAAIGSIFLCHELSMDSTDPLYPDVLEWQLYNAASVGMGRDGASYFYRNPLLSRGGVRRQPWFDTACCPSNISRLWGGISRYVWRRKTDCLFVNQYVTGSYQVDDDASLEIDSNLPWDGDVSVRVTNRSGRLRRVAVRIPSWSGGCHLLSDGGTRTLPSSLPAGIGIPDFNAADYHTLELDPGSALQINLRFEMPINLIAPHPKVRGQRGRSAVTRGPLLYCLESPGRSGLETPDPQMVPGTAMYEFDAELLDGTGTIQIEDGNGEINVLIPYYAWGNREDGAMRVWLKSGSTRG